MANSRRLQSHIPGVRQEFWTDRQEYDPQIQKSLKPYGG
jgi:hypothetical protein